MVEIKPGDNAGVKVLKVIASGLILIAVVIAAFVAAIFELAKKS